MMDVAVKGRGRIGKSAASASSSRDLTSRVSRGDAKGGILSGTARSAILRQAASGDVSMRESRSAPRGGLVELQITGWEKSKASSDKDGGVSSLIRWMEKKSSHRLGSRTRDVRIKKVCCRQRFAGCRSLPCLLAATSGPPSFAANLRTTTAILVYGQRLPDG